METTTATTAATTEAATTPTQEQGTAQGSAEQAQPQATPQLKKFKLKVDGEDFEEEIDLSNESELIKRFQLAKAAEKRIGQSKAEKQKAMEVLKAFEDGTLFKKHPKARELAEQFLVEQLEDEMLSPEQKEFRDLKKYKEDKERHELERQKALEMAAAEQKEAALAQQYQKTIIDALDKSGLPKTPDMAKRMAYIMKKNLDLGLSLTAEDLASEVKTELSGLLKALVGGSDGEQLINLLGEDSAKKIRAWDVKKLKEGMVNKSNVKQEPTVKAPRRDDGKSMSIEEWKEQVKARLKS
jgi:hypothetical protein